MSDAPTTPETLFSTLEALVAKAKEDYTKAREGNQAAGTRCRGTMQEVRKTAKLVRDEMLEHRNKAKESKASKQK